MGVFSGRFSQKPKSLIRLSNTDASACICRRIIQMRIGLRRLMAVGASAAMNIRPRPTQAARADTCRNFIVAKEATVHKRSAAARSPTSYPPGCERVFDRVRDGHRVRTQCYSFLKKPSSGREWLMPSREASRSDSFAISNWISPASGAALSRKCWSMREHALCILCVVATTIAHRAMYDSRMYVLRQRLLSREYIVFLIKIIKNSTIVIKSENLSV